MPQLIFSQIFTDKYIKEANDVSNEWLFNLNNKNYAQAYSEYHEKVKYNSDSISSFGIAATFKGIKGCSLRGLWR